MPPLSVTAALPLIALDAVSVSSPLVTVIELWLTAPAPCSESVPPATVMAVLPRVPLTFKTPALTAVVPW